MKHQILFASFFWLSVAIPQNLDLYINGSFYLHVLPKRLDMLYCDGVDQLGVDCTDQRALYINAELLASTTEQKHVFHCMCEAHAISMRTDRAKCDPQIEITEGYYLLGRYHGLQANSANVNFGNACKPSEENVGEGTEYGDYSWAVPLQPLRTHLLILTISDEDNTCIAGNKHKHQGTVGINIYEPDVRNEFYRRREEVLANGYILLGEHQNESVETSRLQANRIWRQYYPETDICYGHDMTQIYWKFIIQYDAYLLTESMVEKVGDKFHVKPDFYVNP